MPAGAELAPVLRFLKGLADETRLRLLGILANGERTVEELAALLGVRAPTVSHHLSVLKELGLVSMRREGNAHVYRFEGEALRQLGREVVSPDTVARFGAAADTGAWEEKVLRDFLDGDRLKEIPARRKKRLVVLGWLAREFEPGVRYPEARVNEIIGRHHPDFATLRRELVMSRLLARENGVYWVVDPEGGAAPSEGGTGA